MGFFKRLLGLEPKQNNRQQHWTPKNNVGPPASDLPGEIRNILTADFGHLQISENVPVTQILPTQQFGGPIDFVLSSGNAAVAVIMLVQKGKIRTKHYWGVELACEAAKIPIIRFHYHFAFDRPLAVKHIAKYL